MAIAFGSRFAAHRAELLKRASNIGFFQKLTEEERAELLTFGKFSNRSDGDIIFEEGAENDQLMYFVVSGEVEILLKGYQSEGGGNVVATLGAGELFGEVAILDKKPRSAAARAKGPTVVLSLNLFPADAEVGDCPPPHLAIKILYYIAEGLCRKLRNTNKALLHAKE